MKLRDYQRQAHEAVADLHARGATSPLVVMPTGCGKTVLFGTYAHDWSQGRVMIIAHREELIFQAAKKVESIAGDHPEIEMADMTANANGVFGREKVVVASVQTLNSGRRCRICRGTALVNREQCSQCLGHGEIEGSPCENCLGEGLLGGDACPHCKGGLVRRVHKFRPEDFGLVIVDEAHHATAPTYRTVLDHFKQNPDLKILGVTATPDRKDEAALGQIFDTVAYEYSLPDAIRDGWLVPIRQQWITVAGLDFSKVRTTAGDLNEGDLAKILEQEEQLHGIVNPTLEIAGDRATLVFCASVQQSLKVAEIINRHKPESAVCIHGETPKEDRRRLLKSYAEGKYQYLVGCGVFLEGFDEPRVQVVAMARPTKSRALYTQAVGRGTRPITPPQEETPESRRAAIAASTKPEVLILDFVGNSGRHKLVCTADILGGNYDDELVERAIKLTKEQSSGSVDMLDQIEALKKSDEAKQRAREEQERERLRGVVASRATYHAQEISPFDVFDLAPVRSHYNQRPASKKQMFALWKMGIDPRRLTSSEAGRILGEARDREAKGLCSYKQARVLARHGYETKNVTKTEAQDIIAEINLEIVRQAKEMKYQKNKTTHLTPGVR